MRLIHTKATVQWSTGIARHTQKFTAAAHRPVDATAVTPLMTLLCKFAKHCRRRAKKSGRNFPQSSQLLVCALCPGKKCKIALKAIGRANREYPFRPRDHQSDRSWKWDVLLSCVHFARSTRRETLAGGEQLARGSWGTEHSNKSLVPQCTPFDPETWNRKMLFSFGAALSKGRTGDERTSTCLPV